MPGKEKHIYLVRATLFDNSTWPNPSWRLMWCSQTLAVRNCGQTGNNIVAPINCSELVKTIVAIGRLDKKLQLASARLKWTEIGCALQHNRLQWLEFLVYYYYICFYWQLCKCIWFHVNSTIRTKSCFHPWIITKK